MLMFIALLRVRQVFVREQDFRRRAQVVKLDGDERLVRTWIVLPKPRECEFFGWPYFPIRSGYAMDVAALMMHLHAIFSAHLQFQYGHQRGIFFRGSKPASQFQRVGPRAKDSFARRLESSPQLQRCFWGELFFGHSETSVGC